MYINHLESSDDEHIERGGSRPGRKPNKDRLALFTHNCFSMITSPQHPYLMQFHVTKFIGCISL